MTTAAQQKRWRLRARRRVETVLGGACHDGPIGCDGRLELAHREPVTHARPYGTGDANLCEALKHPDRFYLLCRWHHSLRDTAAGVSWHRGRRFWTPRTTWVVPSPPNSFVEAHAIGGGRA